MDRHTVLRTARHLLAECRMQVLSRNASRLDPAVGPPETVTCGFAMGHHSNSHHEQKFGEPLLTLKRARDGPGPGHPERRA